MLDTVNESLLQVILSIFIITSKKVSYTFSSSCCNLWLELATIIKGYWLIYKNVYK